MEVAQILIQTATIRAEHAHEFGLLMTALGAGALLGALTLTVFGQRRPPLSFLILAASLCSAATLALAGSALAAPASTVIAPPQRTWTLRKSKMPCTALLDNDKSLRYTHRLISTEC